MSKLWRESHFRGETLNQARDSHWKKADEENNFKLRVAANSQYGGNPLVAAEQFGLAGSTAVRGFTERAAATDRAYFVSTEIHTPEMRKTPGSRGRLNMMLAI